MAEVKIHGIDEASRKLKLLSDAKTAKSIARKAARKAMNKVRDRARQTAKELDDLDTPAMIWKNITVQSGKTRGDQIMMRVLD